MIFLCSHDSVTAPMSQISPIAIHARRVFPGELPESGNESQEHDDEQEEARHAGIGEYAQEDAVCRTRHSGHLL